MRSVIMSIVATAASLMHTEQVLHKMPDPRSQVHPRPLSVWHPP